MNAVYFYCTRCRVYTDAGYRHCYWSLEHPGHVHRRLPVDVERVLGTEEYLAEDTDRWRRIDLPRVRDFLLAHTGPTHDLRYGDFECFVDYDVDPEADRDWTELA
jgi:hypothetical protein